MAEIDVVLQRQWDMLKALARTESGHTLFELSKQFGVSEKTIKRDVKSIEAVFGKLKTRNEAHGRKRYLYDRNPFTFGLALDRNELLAIYIGQTLMTPLKGTFLWEGIQSGREKIKQILREDAVKYAERVAPFFYRMDPTERKIDRRRGRMIDEAFKSMEDSRALQISYRSLRSKRVKVYEIHPYNFVYWRNSVYLVGFCCRDKKIKIWGLIRYVFAESIYTCSKYLLGMAVTAAILVAVYILLKKILRSELIPILVVLVLSCFPPAIYATRGITNPQLYYLYLGTNMPLLPLGILVGKYRSILIPKKRSLRILYVSIWSALAVLSYATLWLLQPVVLAMNGMQYRYSTSFCATPAVPNNQRINNFLEPYTKAQCITWLVFGLSVVMLLLIFATMFNTDNRLTLFFREHIPEILMLSYSIFFIKFTLARARDPWYDRFPGSLVVGSLVELGIAIASAVVLRKLLGADKRQ